MNTNLGDDLFVETICKRYKDVKFVMNCSAEIWMKLKQLPNLSNINLWRTETIIKKVFKSEKPFFRFVKKCISYISAKKSIYIQKRCTAVVKIGGSIFMEKDVKGLKPLNLEKVPPLSGDCLSQNKSIPPYFIIGANIGPVYTNDFLHTVMEKLSLCESVVFRDKASYNLYRNFSNVRYAPDVIFQYQTECSHECKEKKQIFFSIIAPEKKNLGFHEIDVQNYYKKMAEITQYYINMGYKVVMASFCKPEGDLEAISKVQELLPVEAKMYTTVLSYEGKAKSVLAEMMQSEFLICCRFHSVVLSLLMGKPFFPISYGDKTRNLLSDLCYSGNWTTIDRWKDIPIMEIDSNRRKKTNINIEQFIIGAQKQFEALDSFLEKTKT